MDTEHAVLEIGTGLMGLNSGSEAKNATPKTISSQHFSTLFAKLPIIGAVFDRDMRYIAVSEGWINAYGLQDKTLIGRHHYDILPNSPKVDREAHRKALAGEVVRLDQVHTTRPDGSEAWEKWLIQPIFDTPERVVGIALTAEDITEQKQMEARLETSERRLRLAMGVAQIGLFEKNHETGALYVSPELQSLCALERPPTSIEDLACGLDPVESEVLTQTRDAALDPMGNGVFSIRLHPMIKGEPRAFELRGRVEFDGEGDERRPVQTVGVIFDRTESKRLSEALASAQRLETIGRMAGMIAHDFNNLLTVILSNLEFSGSLILDEEASDHIDRAIAATKLGASFNRRLMSLAGSHGQRPSVFRLDDHLIRTWSIIERVLGEEVTTTLSPGAEGCFVRIDQGELDATILNLVVNAKEAMGDRGKITISTGVVTFSAANTPMVTDAHPGKFITISVADDGKGMAPEVKAKALEPFFTTKASESGTGLGLTSVVTTLARAKGFIDIDSHVGRGTKVTLHLPVASTPLQEPSVATPGDMPMGNGELILVVEDDQLVRETVLERLEALGYAVIDAGDADQAIEHIKNGEPVDLVFSDVILPGGRDGYDVMAAVHDISPEINVLLTSGHTSRRLATSKKSEADAPILAKPYSLGTLAMAISEAIKRT